MKFENQIDIGSGFYTVSDLSQILRIPYQKIHRWVNVYWDGKLGKEFGQNYSWTVDNSKAVSFHTLVEFYVMVLFSEAGVKPKEVLKAHLVLSQQYKTAFPFAQRSVLNGIHTDGKRIFLSNGEDTISLDGTNQFNLSIIRTFFKNLDFDGNELAKKFWPMGKSSSIVIDPERKFGHPILNGFNIYPEVIYGMYKAGDSKQLISAIYHIPLQMVDDAIDFCSAA